MEKLDLSLIILESAAQAQITALNREDLLGDLFHAGGLGYYAQLTALSRLMGLQNGAHYTLQTGILSSALESAVPEQLFTNTQNPGEAISAVKALQKASAAGQRIYHITPANQTTTLANIHHDTDTMADIRNALNAGKEVITHTDTVSVPGWTGAGYIITDADTGAGAYKIAGGGNGGFISLLSILIEVLVLLHVERDTGSLETSQLTEWLGRASTILSFVATLLDLIEDCGLAIAIPIAAFLSVLSYYGAGILLGIAFANTATLISGIFVITLGNFILNFISNIVVDLANTLCKRSQAVGYRKLYV